MSGAIQAQAKTESEICNVSVDFTQKKLSKDELLVSINSIV